MSPLSIWGPVSNGSGTVYVQSVTAYAGTASTAGLGGVAPVPARAVRLESHYDHQVGVVNLTVDQADVHVVAEGHHLPLPLEGVTAGAAIFGVAAGKAVRRRFTE
jgi:hypothetical protein